MTFNLDVGTFLVAIIGAWIAYSQLKKISVQIGIAVKNQRLDSLKVVLEIETQINARKLELDKAAKAVREAAKTVEEAAKAAGEGGRQAALDEETLEILEDFMNATRESYLNALDRLCYCIDKGFIEDKDWRGEYRNVLYEVISEYEDDFREASPYINIKSVNGKWQRS